MGCSHTVDIISLFLQSDDTAIKCQGISMESLLSKDVVYKGRKGVPIIYGKDLKTLHGIVDVSKLFFENLSHLLFERNPYNWHIVKMGIDSKQCTIV